MALIYGGKICGPYLHGQYIWPIHRSQMWAICMATYTYMNKNIYIYIYMYGPRMWATYVASLYGPYICIGETSLFNHTILFVLAANLVV